MIKVFEFKFSMVRLLFDCMVCRLCLLVYNTQRMDCQAQCDLLFQQNTNHPSDDALAHYISPSRHDLPMQITNHPFSHRNHPPENRPFYSRNNHSISKCAITEISRPQEDEQESITPVCQKLFGQHLSRIEKEFDLPPTLPSEQLPSQATFKPTDLREYLRGSREDSKLKQILRQTVFTQPPNSSKQQRSRVASSHLLGTVDEAKQKTKYEKILEEFFNSKVKKDIIKSRLSHEKPNNIKAQYLYKPSQPPEHTQGMLEPLRSREEGSRTAITHSKSQKTIMDRPKNSTQITVHERPQLIKTFSQQNLREGREQKVRQKEKEGKAREEKQGWMRMSFEERQSRTLENRKNKENIGQRANQEKEVKNCTFKPAILDFKPLRKHQQMSGSYHRQYLQRIRRRL